MSPGLGLAREAAAEGCAIRPLDAASMAAFEHGHAVSPQFRAVLARFDSCRVVVHVVTGAISIFGTAGTTTLVGAVGEWRYLRIVLDARLNLAARTAVLAHELWHALEIVESQAETQAGVRQLYERIGQRNGIVANAFETPAAAATGAEVWREVKASVRAARVAAAEKHRPPPGRTSCRDGR